jgi:hypothetical protein
MRFTSRRLTASSSSWGRLVAPMTTTRASAAEATPSNCTRNSVLRRRAASCSVLLRALSRESISSMKMMDGWRSVAMANRVRTCSNTGAQSGQGGGKAK